MAPDILIIGAGVFGLSVAYAAHRAGLAVQVLEAARPGAGASGGVVGALTPHAPTRWRPMMAFQFAALAGLAARAAELADCTGHDPGYRRLGRIVPITSERALARAEADIAAAAVVWGAAGAMQVLGGHARLAPGTTPFGVLHDTLSARISPRAYLAALEAALPAGSVRCETVRAVRTGPEVETAGGRFPAAQVVLAAGWQGWALLPPPLRGSGVKGQAALLRATPDDLPLVTHDGLYVVPHGDGTVAIGSTSERTWTTPGPDRALEHLILRARDLIPALADAPVIERWAGVRPKPPGREPVAGPVPGLNGVWVAGGGFKIGFGIAHAVGDAVVAGILRRAPALALPESFAPEAHFRPG